MATAVEIQYNNIESSIIKTAIASFLVTVGMISAPTIIIPIMIGVPVSFAYFITFTLYAVIIYLSIIGLRALALKCFPNEASTFKQQVFKYSRWIIQIAPIWISTLIFLLLLKVYIDKTNILYRDDFILQLRKLLPIGMLFFGLVLLMGNITASIFLTKSVRFNKIGKTIVNNFFLLIIYLVVFIISSVFLNLIQTVRGIDFLFLLFIFFSLTLLVIHLVILILICTKFSINVFISSSCLVTQLSFLLTVWYCMSYFSYISGVRYNEFQYYRLTRQNCSELASYAIQWAELQKKNQDENSSATICDYYDSLLGQVHESNDPTKQNNWTSKLNVKGNPVAMSVKDLLPPDKKITNPFNRLSVFKQSEEEVCLLGYLGCNVIEHREDPGTIYLGKAKDGDFWYYAFVFKGTDSSPGDNDFHAGQNINTLAGLRNGVFLGRFKPDKNRGLKTAYQSDDNFQLSLDPNHLDVQGALVNHEDALKWYLKNHKAQMD